MRRTVIVVVAAIVVLIGVILYLITVGGASEVKSEQSPAAPSISATVSPTPAPSPGVVLAQWAGGVCLARDGVVATLVNLGKDLSYDPGSGLSVADQFQSQLDAHVGDISMAMEDLGTALGQVPVDYVEASSMITKVQVSGDTLMKARDETALALDAASKSEDPLTLGVALVQAGISAKATFDAGKEFIHVLDEASSPARGELGKAFSAAPACQ